MNEKNEIKTKTKHFANAVTLKYDRAMAALDNPWSESNRFLRKTYGSDQYNESVNLCRFFYKTEPMVSTVINKLVEIGINDIRFTKNGLSDNEFRVFEGMKQRLLEFSEAMAIEYLLSGLVVPEIGYGPADKEFLMTLGVKKYTSLKLPDSMWVRDPKTIKIYNSMLSDKPSYFVKIPEDVIKFINNKGKYPDGKEDKELFELLKTYFPEFVKEVIAGQTELLLDNKLIIRRKYLSDNPYPIPYIAPSLEALQHKRKLRRMDYSIIDKVISAIMHIKVGSDEFPITDSPEDNDFVESILTQLRMRETNQQTLERIFQLVTSHIVDIKWIFPDTAILLDQKKYADITEEILFGLGFPRVLISGETQRSGTSDPELALLSPVQTMNNFRSKITRILNEICRNISELNGFKNVPSVNFVAISMYSFSDFLNGLTKLYDAAAISRTSLDEIFGYDFEAEVDKLELENTMLKARGLPEFGPQPFSRVPVNSQDQPNNPEDENVDNNPNGQKDKNNHTK